MFSETCSTKCVQSITHGSTLRTAWHHYEWSSWLILDCNIFHFSLNKQSKQTRYITKTLDINGCLSLLTQELAFVYLAMHTFCPWYPKRGQYSHIASIKIPSLRWKAQGSDTTGPENSSSVLRKHSFALSLTPQKHSLSPWDNRKLIYRHP